MIKVKAPDLMKKVGWKIQSDVTCGRIFTYSASSLSIPFINTTDLCFLPLPLRTKMDSLLSLSVKSESLNSQSLSTRNRVIKRKLTMTVSLWRISHKQGYYAGFSVNKPSLAFAHWLNEASESIYQLI
jgi:hypothetical protein